MSTVSERSGAHWNYHIHYRRKCVLQYDSGNLKNQKGRQSDSELGCPTLQDNEWLHGISRVSLHMHTLPPSSSSCRLPHSSLFSFLLAVSSSSSSSPPPPPSSSQHHHMIITSSSSSSSSFISPLSLPRALSGRRCANAIATAPPNEAPSRTILLQRRAKRIRTANELQETVQTAKLTSVGWR